MAVSRVATAAAIAAGVLIVAGCSTPEPSPGGSGEPVVIGTTIPLTSALSAGAESLQLGYQTVADRINEAGGICDGRDIKLIIKDDQFDPAKSKTLTRELISEDGAVGILGSYGSAQSLAMSAEADSFGVPGVYPLASVEEMVTRGFDTVFNLFALSSAQELAVDEFLEENVDPESVAIYYVDNPFAIAGAESSKAWLEENGVEVPVFEKYAIDTTDFVSLLSKAQQAEVDVVKNIGYEANHIAYMQAVTQIDLDVDAVYAESDTPFLPRVLEQLGSAAELGLGTSLVPSTEVQELLDALADAAGGTPTSEVYRGAASMMILADALDVADCGESQDVIAALQATDLETPVGHVTFGADGAFDGPVAIGQVQDGVEVILSPEALATGEFMPWTVPSSR